MNNLLATLTEATCSFSCWYAEQKVCRCSCGGKNHGALLDPKHPTPERIVKIQFHKYKLFAVGSYRELYPIMRHALNKLGWAKIGHGGLKYLDGRPYHQAWHENDKGGPVVFKRANDRQYSWAEVKLAKNANAEVYLLWVNLEQPEPLWCDPVEECQWCSNKLIDIWAYGENNG